MPVSGDGMSVKWAALDRLEAEHRRIAARVAAFDRLADGPARWAEYLAIDVEVDRLYAEIGALLGQCPESIRRRVRERVPAFYSRVGRKTH